MTNLRIFDKKVNSYAIHRPNYPSSIFGYLCDEFTLISKSKLADIGSGTGILTKQLLDIGCFVWAVEPNTYMRSVAEKSLNEYEGFVSINGTAENSMLSSKSVDFVTTAQAFHWFDKQMFKHECQRILTQNGKVILIWNCRDGDSAIVQENDNISKKYCPAFSGQYDGMRGARHGRDFEDFFEGEYKTEHFENNITFDSARFLGLHQSASYAPNPNENLYDSYMDELQNFFDRNSKDGILVMPNITKCYVGGVH
jgi:ubiquinone/menaquinone biosynthesis C-methylase UbiE